MYVLTWYELVIFHDFNKSQLRPVQYYPTKLITSIYMKRYEIAKNKK